MVLKLEWPQKSLKGAECWPPDTASESAGLGGGLGPCIPQLPRHADAPGLATSLVHRKNSPHSSDAGELVHCDHVLTQREQEERAQEKDKATRDSQLCCVPKPWGGGSPEHGSRCCQLHRHFSKRRTSILRSQMIRQRSNHRSAGRAP